MPRSFSIIPSPTGTTHEAETLDPSSARDKQSTFLQGLKRRASRAAQGIRSRVSVPASKLSRSKDVHYAELAKVRDRWQAAHCPQSGSSAEELAQMSARYLKAVEDRPRTQELQRRIAEARSLIERSSPPSPPLASPTVPAPATRWDGPSPPVVSHPDLDLIGTPLAPILEIAPSAATMSLDPSPMVQAPLGRVRFREVEDALAEFRVHERTHAPDQAHVSRLNDVASAYLTGHPQTKGMGTLTRLRRNVAFRAQKLACAQQKKLLSLQARGVDPAELPLFHPKLRDRAEARGRDAARLRDAHPDLNRESHASSDRRIKRSDGQEVYRLVPLNTRMASTPEVGPQHAALASGLRFKLQDAGLHLSIPDATPVSFEGQSAMLLDAVDLPDPADLTRISADELHRAALAQWIAGRPNPRWEDFGQDERGRLVMRQTPFRMCSPRFMAQLAQSGGSELFKVPTAAMHQPLAPALRDAVLKLDLVHLQRRLDTERDLIDLACAMKGQADHHAAAHYSYLPKESAARLIEPLRALQTALRACPDLPLAMVLADAADVLESSPFA